MYNTFHVIAFGHFQLPIDTSSFDSQQPCGPGRAEIVYSNFFFFHNEEAAVSWVDRARIKQMPDSQTSEGPALTSSAETRLKNTTKFYKPQLINHF